MRTLVMESHLPLARSEVFPFFADASNLARITPSELGFEILSPLPTAMGEGCLIDYRIRLWGVPMDWRTRISKWDPERAFADEQLRGPYRAWHHAHEFRDAPDGGTVMTDRVRFALPFEPFSLPVLPLVKLQLRRIFRHRDSAVRSALGLPPSERLPHVAFL